MTNQFEIFDSPKKGERWIHDQHHDQCTVITVWTDSLHNNGVVVRWPGEALTHPIRYTVADFLSQFSRLPINARSDLFETAVCT